MAPKYTWRGWRKDPTRHKPRRVQHAVVNRVDLSELTPPLPRLLGHAAYLQLSFFESLGAAVATSPSTSSKENLSRIASTVLERHHALVAELRRIGEDPHAAMEPFVAPVDAFRAQVTGANWYESVLSYYVTSGILDDAFRSLIEGLGKDRRDSLAEILDEKESHAIIVAELGAAIDQNPRLASRLALWGRRLVGDVLLQTRSALALPVDTAPDDPKLEPIFSELIAAHTRRMDDLGLTA